MVETTESNVPSAPTMRGITRPLTGKKFLTIESFFLYDDAIPIGVGNVETWRRVEGAGFLLFA
jgi:hypothetical protein